MIIALLGWRYDELYDRWSNYYPTAKEKDAFSDASHTSHGELNLKDILKTNSIRGFQVT